MLRALWIGFTILVAQLTASPASAVSTLIAPAHESTDKHGDNCACGMKCRANSCCCGPKHAKKAPKQNSSERVDDERLPSTAAPIGSPCMGAMPCQEPATPTPASPRAPLSKVAVLGLALEFPNRATGEPLVYERLRFSPSTCPSRIDEPPEQTA